MELEERPPPPGGVIAQRVAYAFIALSLLVTIVTVLLIMFVVGFVFVYG